MSPRQELHQLLDEIPDRDLPKVSRALKALRAKAHDPLIRVLDEAPFDDEPNNDDLDGGLTEARRTADEGQGMTTDELRRKLGLS